MKIQACHLIALLPLVLQLPPHTTAQCDRSSPRPVAVCLALYQAMEAALYTNVENLYLLLNTFYPDNQPRPVLINVTYEVSFDSVPETPCPGTGGNETLFNTTGTQNINYGWSSTSVYTVFHPALLNRMQIQLSIAMIKWIVSTVESSGSTRAFLWDGVGSLQSLSLDVSVPNFFCTPSEEQVDNVLTKVNTKLQAYARFENGTTVDTEYNGYNLEGTTLSPTSWNDIDDIEGYSSGTTLLLAINIVALLILAIVTLVAFLYVFFRYCIHESSAKVIKDVALQAMVRGGLLQDDWLEKGKEKKKQLYSKKNELQSIFWAFTFVLTYCSAGITITELVMFLRWCADSACGDGVTITKFVCYIVLVVFFTTVGFLFLLKPLPPPSPALQVLAFIWFPIPILGWIIYFCISPFNKRRTKKFQKRWPKITASLFSFLPSFAFGITIATVLIGLIPTLLMAIVYPGRILTFYIFIALLVTVVAIILIVLDNEDHVVASTVSGFLAFILLVPFLVLFSSGYQMLFSGGPGALMSAIVASLLPSLVFLVAVVPWVYRIWTVFIHPEEDECKCCCKKEEKGEEEEDETAKQSDQRVQESNSSANSKGLYRRAGKTLDSDESTVELSNYQLVKD